MDAAHVQAAVEEIATRFAADRRARQQRTGLEKGDFDRLGEAGLRGTGLPAERGGLWRSVRESTRGICEIYRTLAGGDSSVALVCSMHPAVLAFWLATTDVPEPDSVAWKIQRNEIFDTVEAGAWWGTVTSEPGSGGDVSRTKAVARREGDRWRVSGQKHFGSGTGVTSYMITTAVPDGEDQPDWFFVPVDGVALDGSSGVELVAPWDGLGMRATQSHTLSFTDCPAVRVAWAGHLQDLITAASPFFGALFTAVVLGVVDMAVETARQQIADRAGSLRPYEMVEWTEAELDAWTAIQVYEGMLGAIESDSAAAGAVLRGKVVAARRAESCLTRICRVLGGGTFARHSPFGNWFEDVRALGFLRPPWTLAYDGLLTESLDTSRITAAAGRSPSGPG